MLSRRIVHLTDHLICTVFSGYLISSYLFGIILFSAVFSSLFSLFLRNYRPFIGVVKGVTHLLSVCLCIQHNDLQHIWHDIGAVHITFEGQGWKVQGHQLYSHRRKKNIAIVVDANVSKGFVVFLYRERKCAVNYNKWHNKLIFLNCNQHFANFKP